MKNSKELIGERIDEALKAYDNGRGMKQKALADKLGMGDQENTVSKWVWGTRIPDIKRIKQIAETLNVTADYLLGISPDPTGNPDIKAVYKDTGLTQNAVKSLRSIPDKRTLNKLLCSEQFAEIVKNLGLLNSPEKIWVEHTEDYSTLEDNPNNNEVLIFRADRNFRKIVDTFESEVKQNGKAKRKG